MPLTLCPRRSPVANPVPQPTLIVKIDAALAAEYRDAYLRAFGARDSSTKSLQEFIAGFVEDRLAEEIAFVEEETASGRR